MDDGVLLPMYALPSEDSDNVPPFMSKNETDDYLKHPGVTDVNEFNAAFGLLKRSATANEELSMDDVIRLTRGH